METIKLYSKKNHNIFLINISNEIIDLNFGYNSDFIKLEGISNTLEPKKVIQINIENWNIKDETELKINDYLIKVKNISIPNIKLVGSNLNCNLKNLENKDLEKYTLITIDKSFKINRDKLLNKKNDINIFSFYLIDNDKIISKEVTEYKIEEKNDRRQIYGFSVEKFDLFGGKNKNKKDLKICLSFKNNYLRDQYKNIFTNDERNNYKNKLKNFKSEIENSDNKNINDLNDIITK